jgi:hypothetical protein
VLPLLQLSHLKKLQIEITGTEAECEALWQLSSLTHLQELGVSCCASEHELGSAAAAAAWDGLRLRQLEVRNVPASFVQQLTDFQGLTRLGLVDVHAKQVAAVIGQLPTLRSLVLKPFSSVMKSEWPALSQRGSSTVKRQGFDHAQVCEVSFATIAALLQAMGGLPEMAEVWFSMELLVESDGFAVQQLYRLCRQLLHGSLVWHCQVLRGLNVYTEEGVALSMCGATSSCESVMVDHNDHEALSNTVRNGDEYQLYSL